ncbi:redoxin domain-containing protein [Mucilaginibacter sp.]|uniref:redoxin domain-containing protein n=1 Tax=Mucilaginibacter sp. TaxID=1882438 RepID=UPI0035BBB4EA
MKNFTLKTLVAVAALLLSVRVTAQTGLKIGAEAPAFKATDNNGKKADLKALLKQHKAVVLFFYRGQWCPYCNKQMAHIQDSLQLLNSKGAYVIGITPELPKGLAKRLPKPKLPILLCRIKGTAS